MPLNLFIIGPSGCGKSTQAKLIAEKYNLTHYSMGQIFRDEIASNSDLGLKAKSFVDKGTPVPDEVVFPLITQALEKINNQNYIFDGFPRLVTQGEYIDDYLVQKGHSTSMVIHLLVDFLEIVRRRQKKGIEFQDQSRSDNTPEAIANRQKILYQQGIGPILERYQKLQKLYEVDGNRPIEPIFADISVQIDKLLGSKS
ncbi:MAG: nucleoside monophosphate kinase [Candidatus Shapirobacteria bacterium]|jgi:adenylate kinase